MVGWMVLVVRRATAEKLMLMVVGVLSLRTVMAEMVVVVVLVVVVTVLILEVVLQGW